MAFTAVFDACVLYPAPLRDLLLWLARTGLFRARWTDRIHDEWIDNLLRSRPDLDRARLHRTRQQMDEAIEDCLVTGYELFMPGPHLPYENDRHVLAAAVRCRADVVVTFNLRDFPPDVLGPLGIEAQHPDAFARHALDLDPVALSAVRHCRANLKNPPGHGQRLCPDACPAGPARHRGLSLSLDRVHLAPGCTAAGQHIP